MAAINLVVRGSDGNNGPRRLSEAVIWLPNTHYAVQ